MSRRVSPPLLAAVLLVLFLGCGIALTRSAPLVRTVSAVVVPAAAGEAVLGWQELGQRYDESRSADVNHLLVRRTKSGWKIANVSRRRKVDVAASGRKTLFLKRWAIRPGDHLSVGGQALEVVRAEPGNLVLAVPEERIRVTWDGKALRYPESAFVCDQATLLDRVRRGAAHWIRSMIPGRGDKETRCFSIGGRVHTPARLGLPGVPPVAMIVHRYGDRYFFGPGREDLPYELSRPGQEPRRFGQLTISMTGAHGTVQRVVLGRTYYKVDADTKRFKLIPIANQDVWPAEGKDLQPRNPDVKIHMETPRRMGAAGTGIVELAGQRGWEFGLLLLFLSALLLAGVRALLVRTPGGRRRHPFRSAAPDAVAAWALACIFVPTTLFVWRIRGGVDLSTLLTLAWISWAWATLHLMWRTGLRGRTGHLWAAALFLAGFGTLTLSQLALGADNTRWIDYARRHVIILALFGWTAPLLSLPEQRTIREAWAAFVTGDATAWKWFRRGAAVLGAALLVLQLFFGGEQGLWGLQPAEMGKLLLVFVAAFVGMDLAELRTLDARPFRDDPLPWIWRVIRVLFLFSLLVVMVLVGVHDISPVLILLVFLAAWLWAVAPHPWGKTRSGLLFRGALLLGLLVLSGAVRWAYEDPTRLPGWVHQRDRFLVWSQPEQHAYSGEQALKAVALAGAAGWSGGAGAAFGPNGPIMELPMVHNDFIGSFVIFKFGGLAALILLLVQMVYLQALFEVGHQVKGETKDAGHRHRRAGNVLYLTLFGLAWMHGVQWLIAWGNALGLLPVMGQPMTWISLATSHMAFFGLPTLALALMAGRMVETD